MPKEEEDTHQAEQEEETPREERQEEQEKREVPAEAGALKQRTKR